MRQTFSKPPKSEIDLAMEEEGWERTRWWRAVGPDGTLLAETSNPKDFDRFDLPVGTSIQKMYQRIEYNWIEDSRK